MAPSAARKTLARLSDLRPSAVRRVGASLLMNAAAVKAIQPSVDEAMQDELVPHYESVEPARLSDLRPSALRVVGASHAIDDA